MDKIKVLFFLPRWSNGGMERAALNIVKNSLNADFEYNFLVGNYEEDFEAKEIEKFGINFVPLQKFAHYNFITVLMNLDQYLSTHKYDIIHCHINNAIGLLFAYIARRHNIRVVAVHTHNNAFGEGNLVVKNILRKVALLFFRNIPDLYFACSEESGEWTFGKKVKDTGRYRVIYNGVDSERFVFSADARKILREKYGLEKCFIIGHVGHFNYQKNHEFLIHIFPMILREIPDAHLFMIGTGETKAQIMAMVEQHNLTNYISMIEPVNNIQDYYAMFDVLTLPSHFEGFGLVAVEAQCSGLQVICSEQVPRETDISGKTSYLSIKGKQAETLWVNALVQIKRCDAVDRMECCATERFDNCEITKVIEESYEKIWKIRNVKFETNS